jgi:hypothetical protein
MAIITRSKQKGSVQQLKNNDLTKLSNDALVINNLR